MQIRRLGVQGPPIVRSPSQALAAANWRRPWAAGKCEMNPWCSIGVSLYLCMHYHYIREWASAATNLLRGRGASGSGRGRFLPSVHVRVAVSTWATKIDRERVDRQATVVLQTSTSRTLVTERTALRRKAAAGKRRTRTKTTETHSSRHFLLPLERCLESLIPHSKHTSANGRGVIWLPAAAPWLTPLSAFFFLQQSPRIGGLSTTPGRSGNPAAKRNVSAPGSRHVRPSGVWLAA